jgi:hypothetical protein
MEPKRKLFEHIEGREVGRRALWGEAVIHPPASTPPVNAGIPHSTRCQPDGAPVIEPDA